MSERMSPGDLFRRVGDSPEIVFESEEQWYEDVARAFLDACARDGVAGYVVRAVEDDIEAKAERRLLDVLHRKGALRRRALQQSIGYGLGPGVFAGILDRLREQGAVAIDARGMVSLARG